MADPNMLVFSVDYRIVVLYQVLAPVGAIVTGYTWWRARRDLACLTNSLAVRVVRDLFLLRTSASLVGSSIYFSIEAVLVTILLGFVNMAINAYALRQRENPSSGSGATVADGWKRNYPPTFLEFPERTDPEYRASSVIRFPGRSAYPRPL
jgi:hypothetical protein